MIQILDSSLCAKGVRADGSMVYGTATELHKDPTIKNVCFDEHSYQNGLGKFNRFLHESIAEWERRTGQVVQSYALSGYTGEMLHPLFYVRTREKGTSIVRLLEEFRSEGKEVEIREFQDEVEVFCSDSDGEGGAAMNIHFLTACDWDRFIVDYRFDQDLFEREVSEGKLPILTLELAPSFYGGPLEIGQYW